MRLPDGRIEGASMKKEEIERINALARKMKTEGLTEEEKLEQANLRAAYIAEFRQSLKNQLDNTTIVRPDGTREKLVAKGEKE